MIDIIINYLKTLIGILEITNNPPAVVKEPTKYNFKLAWKNEEWTKLLTQLVSDSTLPRLTPVDVPAWYKGNEVEYWCQLISIMAKYESNFNPDNKYDESRTKASLKGVVSRGLLQISLDSGKSYNPDLKSADELHDVKTNLLTGIKIFERWVAKHNKVMGQNALGYYGGSKYWSVLRDHSDSKPKIVAYLNSLHKAPVTRELIAKTIVKHMSKHLGQRETHGSNRSPLIDSILKWVGTSLGNPYCAAAVSKAVDEACLELGLKNPTPKTAGSQKMISQTPMKYRKASSGKIGDIGGMRSKSDPSKGHVYVLTADEANGKHPTVEANTNLAGDREGDGWFERVRDLSGDSSKKFVAFLDFPQWILDFNSGV